jgi:hypothetical protein
MTFIRARRSMAARMMVCGLLAVSARPLQAQVPALSPLMVGGDVPAPAALTAADLQRLPRTFVTVTEGGAAVRYEGVALAELLRKVGGPAGEALRGRALAQYVVAEGADGYRAVFGVTEGDPDFTDHPVIVADRRDGEPLSAAQGPFRLIASSDKRPTRSVRALASLTVHRIE